MNIISRAATRLLSSRPQVAVADVQGAPVTWSPDGGLSTITTKIDHAIRVGSALLVGGWSSAPGQLRLRVGSRLLDSREFRTSRPDVARYLNLGDAETLGLVLLATDATRGPIVLECVDADGGAVATFALNVGEEMISADAQIQLAPALACLRESIASDGASLRQLDNLMSTESIGNGFSAGALDDIRASTDTRQGIASGWLVRLPGVEAWLEDAQGRRFSLDDAHWVHRGDVSAITTAELANFTERTGFLLPIENIVPGDRIRLVTRRDAEVAALAEASCMSWGSDPVMASRWLFGYPTPIARLAERMQHLDLALIEPLIRARQRHWPDLPVQVEDVGTPVASPRASIIIPLYGRFEFVEHQLIEFARDAWLTTHTEIIYVIDDLTLVDRMASEAWNLLRLYGVSFRWIWGGSNRGFSGANNLGVAHARGERLVFLNSDAFPRQPGWLQALLDALEGDPGLGAVGPRLLFADGSIQHAGMDFRRREDLGIWTNHHPHMGLDPVLDPHQSFATVPCVTGACLAMRRADFDRVGGWDTGYLIGDFEDSDLCLKLRAAGKSIGYLPTVELTHLERQSFKLLGEGDYRMRVVIYNAVRHQQRWPEAFAADPVQEQTQ
jgi:GT2 family glycosyltransferase